MKYTIYLILLLFAACDTYKQDDYTPEFVVESYLIAEEPLPIVKLSETSPINARYRFEDLAIEGATVTVSLLGEDGEAEETYRYSAESRGVYAPLDPHDVLPLRQYELHIVPPYGSDITASTIVPGAFDIMPLPFDTLIYQSEESLEFQMTFSAYPGRPAIYMNKVHALDTSYALTPLYQDFAEDDDEIREEVIENSSGITNEANFYTSSDEFLLVTLPWVGVAYYGPNDIVVDAIDDNLFDFLRSREENGLRPPGERENTIDHITGGRGIFGSLTREQVRIFVAKE